MKLSEKTMYHLTGIKDYDNINDCFVMNDDTYMDIVRIRCHDLYSCDESAVLYECYTILKWIKVYPCEFEWVGLNFPVDTTFQQINMEHIINRTENPDYEFYLEQKLNELQQIDQNMVEKQFYLFLFYDDEKELRIQREKTINHLNKASLVERINRFQKELILYKLNNKNSAISKEKIRKYNDAPEQFYTLTDKQKKENDKAGYNKQLLNDIGVRGGINFYKDSRFTITGTGYEACIYIYEYPETLERHWLINLFNLERVITSIHVSPKNMKEVKKNINKTLGEQESRINMATKQTDVRDARQAYEENLILYEEIKKLGEIIDAVSIRLYLSAPTYNELDQLVADTIASLEADNFKCCVYLEEQEADWKAIYQPYKKQQLDVLRAKKGNPFKATTLAFGDPFHFSSLCDDTGEYWGLTTSTSGPVIPDFWAKTKNRNYYNGILYGGMGSGKSTILKKLFKLNAIRGNYIRGFDISGEWIDLVHEFGGRIIALDGSDGRINPLEILKTAEEDATSYKQHINKCSTVYKYLKPSAKEDEILEYENLLNMLYQSYGFIDSVGKLKNKITGLPHNAYPTYSNLLDMITKIIESTNFENLSDAERIETEDKIEQFIKIKRTTNNIVKNLGDILDGYTTIDDILSTQIIFYDIRGIAKMKDNVFDAIMFSALSLCYDNCIQIGSVMKNSWEKWESGDKENGLHWLDLTRFLILVDEFHRILNANKLMALDQILTFQREARKFFGGIWFASQSINDSVPDLVDNYGVSQLQKMFELCQYKIIMKQDASTVDKLKYVFRGEIPEKEIEMVPKFETGQCILNIQGGGNIMFKTYITDAEKALFKGGA